MAEVGPGGHFFGSAHTLERYETAFYRPLLSDWRNFETWQEDGARTATERANGIWKQLLAEYVEPPLDPAVRATLDAFVARRSARSPRPAEPRSAGAPLPGRGRDAAGSPFRRSAPSGTRRRDPRGASRAGARGR